MAFVFEMPEVGEGVVEAEIGEWKVAVGDAVTVDQPLCEITTDKASLEIRSPRAGTIVALYGQPGESIAVNTPLVDINTDAAAAPAAPPAAAAPAAPASAPPAPAAPSAIASNPGTRGITKATPAVRRNAQEQGVDLSLVPGTGHGGRVTHDDIASFQRGTPAEATPLPLAPVALPQVRPSGSEERIKIMGIRRKIAQRMQAAKRTAPHFTYVEEVDCTRLVEARTELKALAAERGVRLSYLAFFAKACSVAFRDFPNVNSWMDDEAGELVIKGDHHIGIATDTPNGLMVPVIFNVEQKSILRIAAEMQDLFERTKAGKALPSELSGSTFTITGVGGIGGVLATPILNLPEVGILGVNQIKKRAVVLADDSIVARHMTYLSPSFDHRIIDGAVAARFVSRLKEILENPTRLLLELA